ncbi:MAG TPA: type II toxin-antitoxin system RelE/ParE family toxin [Chitinophagales bacterium]|nr:type II toxin-antitoxin system RelE/ParE family toxin [Chitinophagales bacterium]
MEEFEIVIKEYALDQLQQEYYYYAENYSLDYAEKFRLEFFKRVSKILPLHLSHPECRFLPTKNHIYRNIVWGNYLIVYKVKKKVIEVLCLFHSKQNPKKLKRLRRLK